MKAESTIRKQIARLRRVVDSRSTSVSLKRRSYDAYHALRWVIEDVAWTPAGLAESEAGKTDADN